MIEQAFHFAICSDSDLAIGDTVYLDCRSLDDDIVYVGLTKDDDLYDGHKQVDSKYPSFDKSMHNAAMVVTDIKSMQMLVKFKKETSMIKKTIDTNKTMAVTAAVNETARIVNKKASTMLAKAAPMAVRGYVDTAFGRLVSANLFVIAIENLRPNDPRLKKLSEAMVAQAYQELYQELDIEGLLDKLLAGVNLDKLVEKS
jgi:hypothetical protein